MKDSELRLRIMQQRIRHGLNQTELAKRVGVSQRSISMWENGEAIPRNTTRIKLANAFGLAPDYFFSDESEEELDEDNNIYVSADDSAEEEMLEIMEKLLTHYYNDADKVVSKIIEYSDKRFENKGDK